jgi:hypothetical protein
VKRLVSAQLLTVAFAIVLLLVATPSVEAGQVEYDWPVGTPNPPRNDGDLVVDFETGLHGIGVDRTIPGLLFGSKLPFAYGDLRVGEHDPKLANNGSFFASPDPSGDPIRVDFLGGAASYASVLVSNAVPVTLRAYSARGVLIDEIVAEEPNVGTETLTRLTVEGASAPIDYLMLYGAGDWRLDDLIADAAPITLPVPGRLTGSHDTKFDLVFIPDSDYGTDIDVWLPTFLDHISHQISDRLGGQYPVTGNLGKFNFYYTKRQGVARTKTLPAGLTEATPWADAYVILHTEVFGDSCRMTFPAIYGAEGQLVPANAGRSFIHESGHGIFGLADEYDGGGAG